MGRLHFLLLDAGAALPCTLAPPRARGLLFQPPYTHRAATLRPLHTTSHSQASLDVSSDSPGRQSVACKAASERLTLPGQGQQRQNGPSPPAYPGLVLELECARLALEGKGVCLLPPTGFVVLVERTLPGERVRAEVQEVKHGYAEARKLASLAPHRHAVVPVCPYFGPCGGCSLQSLAYQAQLREKRNQVEQTLRRVGRLGPALDALKAAETAPQDDDLPADTSGLSGTHTQEHDTLYSSSKNSRSSSSSSNNNNGNGTSGRETVGSRDSGGAVAVRSTAGTGAESESRMGGVCGTVGCQEPFAYRNKMAFHFSGRCWDASKGVVTKRPALGFLRPGSADVVLPVVRHGCALQAPVANHLLSRVEQLVSEHQLLPYNDPSGKGFLKQLVIRRGSGVHPPGGVARAPYGSTPPATSVGCEDEYMVAFGVTDGLGAGRLQPVAEALTREFPELASVVVQQLPAALQIGRTPRGPDQQGGQGGGRGRQGREKHVRRHRGGSGSGVSDSLRMAGAEGITAHPNQSANTLSDSPNGGHGSEGAGETLLYGQPYIHDNLCGLTFRISPSSFFQTNSKQVEVLYGIVRQAAGLRQGDALLDLYCGTGSIGLSLAADCRVVLGVEVAESAVSDARRNAALNNITNAYFLCADVDDLPRAGELLRQQHPTSKRPQGEHQEATQSATQSVARQPLLTMQHQQPTAVPPRTGAGSGRGEGKVTRAGRNGVSTDTAMDSVMVDVGSDRMALAGAAAGAVGVAAVSPDVVIVDPARAGLSAATVGFLAGCGARRVVYVSCNVATQARDLARLCNGPGAAYRLVAVTPVDMFPHTDHVETVVVLERRAGGEKGRL